MTDQIIYRGPDDSGHFSTENLGLGMRRLSIIDIEGGHQPMTSEEGVVIVFNGEIYNHNRLRDELKLKGHIFKTRSDTEVILQSYMAHGPSFVDHLQGMFAIGIYDPRDSSLQLYRDRVGIKPLYYLHHNEGFFFGSEIKAILSALSHSPELNFRSIQHFLSFRYVPGPETIWEGILKLMPGHHLRLDLKTARSEIQKYWEVRVRSLPFNEGEPYQKKFTDLFLKTVESHLVASDVPVGVLLSGGLDSSAVCAAAIEIGHQNFHTFNVSFQDSGEFSESRYARALSNHLKSVHHEVTITHEDFVGFLEKFVELTDEPLADLASIPLHFVCQLASKDVKVVMAGEGSDEILAGYNLDLISKRVEWLKNMHSLTPIRLAQLISNFIPNSALRDRAKSFLSEGVAGYLKRIPTHMTYVWTDEEKTELFSGAAVPSSRSLIESWYASTSSQEPIDQYLEVHFGSWLVEDLLMKADRMSMGNSLELRVPFLDHKLVEFCMDLPLEWKVGSSRIGYSSKRILREFSRSRIPREIIERPKQGFPVPAYRWLSSELSAWAHDLILNSHSKIHAFLNVEKIRSEFTLATKGHLRSAHKVWNLIILELWFRRWK